MTKPYGELKFIYQNITMTGEKRYVVNLKGYEFYLHSPSSDKTLLSNNGVDFYHMPLSFMKRYMPECPICGERMSYDGPQSICKNNVQLNFYYNICEELEKLKINNVFFPLDYPPIEQKEKISDNSIFR